jgi:xanthomonalisin
MKITKCQRWVCLHKNAARTNKFMLRQAFILIATALCLPMKLAGQPSFRQLQGSVPAVAANLAPIGALEADKRIKIEISLPLRNKDSLEALIEDLYDPQSPKYRQYLTPAEFTAAFGPTDADLQSVVAFAVSNNLTIVNTTSDRRLLYATAPISTIEQVFQVSMLKYQHPSEARTFYAPDREPLVPANLPISGIYGLSDFPRPHTGYSTNSLTMAEFDSLTLQPCVGSGANGTFMGVLKPCARATRC